MSESSIYPDTYDILLDRVERGTDCKRCVEWAIGLLLQGCEFDFVSRLAGQTAPFDADRIGPLRDKALKEIGFDNLDEESVVCHILAHSLRKSLGEKTAMERVLRNAREFYVVRRYQSLQPLYMLSHALEEFAEFNEQWYIPGMNRENIDARTCEIVQDFARRHPNPS